MNKPESIFFHPLLPLSAEASGGSRQIKCGKISVQEHSVRQNSLFVKKAKNIICNLLSFRVVCLSDVRWR